MQLNGLDFHVETAGGGGLPLLLLHGFTGSVRTWDGVRPALAEFATVISMDLIGHGRSAAPDDRRRYSFDWSSRDLAALLDSLELEAVDLLGYSMGGRVALQFALDAPGRVNRLILESASAGIDDDDERTARERSDAALAERIVDKGIETFVAEWERLPLLAPGPHVSQADRAQQTLQRLHNTRLGLANSLRGMGAGRQASLWPALSQLKAPSLAIVGERDARYRQIAERMRSLTPRCEVATVPGAGHTVHLDAPDVFVALVESALARN